MALGRIVVVGCGSIGRRHASQLALRSDVSLEICDLSEENIAMTLEVTGTVPVHTSFNEMIKTAPQMVVIATPPMLHADQTIDALRAGAHVLCEKPMSDTLESAKKMLAVAEQTAKVLDIGFTLHFHPAVQFVKQLIDNGRLGRILHIHWHVGTYGTLVNSISRHQASTYAALVMDYAHQPDIVYYWLNKEPVRVSAIGCMTDQLPLASEPNVASILLEYDCPLLATINLNYVQHPQRVHCELIGERAWVSIDFVTNSVTVGDRISGTTDATSVTVDRDRMYRDEHQAFFDAVEGRRPPESPASRALHSMRVVETAIHSLRTHSPQELLN